MVVQGLPEDEVAPAMLSLPLARAAPRTETAAMMSTGFWKTRYVLDSDPEVIDRNVRTSLFVSGSERFDLLVCERNKDAPNILIPPGSAGHAHVFAEPGYHMHLRGYNVFIMPKHDGATVGEPSPVGVNKRCVLEWFD